MSANEGPVEHGYEVCEHGIIHGRCACLLAVASLDTLPMRRVVCDQSAEHANTGGKTWTPWMSESR